MRENSVAKHDSASLRGTRYTGTLYIINLGYQKYRVFAVLTVSWAFKNCLYFIE